MGILKLTVVLLSLFLGNGFEIPHHLLSLETVKP